MAGSSGSSGPTPSTRVQPIWWLLLLLAVAPYFVGLGASTIWDANEAFYVETPRQMVLSGDYINPSFNGEPRFNKPVLSYWIVAAFYRELGVSVKAERIAIAVGVLGLFVATFVIGRVAYSFRAGVLAALILASSPRVLMWGRRIFIDVYLALFMALTLMFFVLAQARPEHRRRYLLLMYVAIGLGVLTKGPVAAVMPLLIALAYFAWTRQLSEWRRLMRPTGALIVIVIVAPWYVAVYAQHGWRYIVDFFVGENIGRYTETVGVQDRRWWFYLPVLFTDLFPWALLLPAAAYAAWMRQRSGQNKSSANFTRLFLVWAVTFVLVFTCSSTKQDLYIFPIAPVLAVLFAVLVDRALAGDLVARRLTMVTLAAVAIALLIAGVTMARFWGVFAGDQRLIGATTLAIVLAAGACAIGAAVINRESGATIAALATTAIAANWVLVLVVLPGFERYKPVAPMTEIIRARGSDHAVVAHYSTVLPSMVYYLNRPIVSVFDMPSLQALVASTPELFVLMKPDEYEDLRQRVSTPLCVIDSRPIPEVKIGTLLGRAPWPQLLLVGASDECRAR